MKTKLFYLFSICFLVFSLSACNQTSSQQESSETTKNQAKEEIKELKEKAEEKKFSPDRRLETFLIFPEENKPVYRLTIADNEQSKIIFSREFELINPDLSETSSGTRSVTIEKVLDNFVLLKEFSGQKENLKYLLIQPDSGEVKILECKDFSNFEINLNEKNYKCKGLKAGKETEEEFALPEIKEMPKNDFQPEQKQSKELENLKVELWPFDEAAKTTPFGQRANLKVFKDNILIYQKNFSGKCTDCQWVNQDNFKEAFRIESLQNDKILLTQLLQEEGQETMFSSMIVIPSKKKIVHLDCKELEGEIAYVSQITDKDYECKYVNVAKATTKQTLPIL